MRIVEVQLYRYELPLHRPITLKNHQFRVRSGLLVRVEGENGRWGWGDVAPLPGWSDEKLEEIEAEAVRVARSITGCVVPSGLHVLSDRFERWLTDHHLSASLCCGLQTAVMTLEAQSAGKDLCDYFSSTPLRFIPVNGLLISEEEDVLDQARAMAQAGYTTMKLKVGRGDPAREADLVRTLIQVVGEEVRLRLDANRAWDYDTAVTFARCIADCPIEYIEEPLKDPSLFVEFSRRTRIPVALDETVLERGVKELERWRGVEAVVLKATLLGGFEFTMWMVRRVLNLGITPVVSAVFESGVGIVALANFASALNQPQVACGLDTYRWLAHDVLADRLDMSEGKLDLEKANHALTTIRVDSMEELYRVRV